MVTKEDILEGSLLLSHPNRVRHCSVLEIYSFFFLFYLLLHRKKKS